MEMDLILGDEQVIRTNTMWEQGRILMRRIVATLLFLLILPGIFAYVKASERQVFAYYKNGIAQFMEEGYLGLVNAEGEVILPAEYKYISPRYSDGLAFAENESGTTGIDENGNIVFALPVGEVLPFKNERTWGYGIIDGSYGIHMIDKSGRVLDTPVILYAEAFSDELAFCVRRTEEAPIGCYLNTNGEVAFDFPYAYEDYYEYPDYFIGDRLYDKSFNNGLALFGYQDSIYLIDKQGNIVRELPALFDFMDFSFGSLSVARDPETRLIGYMNIMGEYVVPPVGRFASSAYPMIEERGLLEIERRLWRCYDETGQQIFEMECDSISPFYQGYAAIRNEIKGNNSDQEINRPLSEMGHDAFLNLFIQDTSQGDEIATDISDHDETDQSFFDAGSKPISPFHQWGGILKNETNIIDKEGNILLKGHTAVFWWDTRNYSPISDGLIAFEEGGKYGFIDINGEIVIAPQFEKLDVFRIKEYNYMAVHFYDGYARVKKEGQWYLINTRGEIVSWNTR